MALNLVLVQQRQSARGIALSWTPLEGASAHQVFVACRRLLPEELEAAASVNGTVECFVAKVGGDVTSVIDDITPPGEARHYGVAMVFADGTVRPARFRTLPEGGRPESFHLSELNRAQAAAPPPAPPQASAPTRAPGPVPTPSPARPAAPGPPLRPAVPPDVPPPPSSLPLQDTLELRMQGATQTWDGLRIHWERDPRAAAYEIIASDHQIFSEELADALAGRADFTTVAAVGPTVTCVIDNVTPREARGWYAVLVRSRDGHRTPHPFKLGDAASGRASAPFLNPNRTGELRAEVEALLADAREQWERWRSNQDAGARHEAKRMVADALLIWPGHPAAQRLLAEIG